MHNARDSPAQQERSGAIRLAVARGAEKQAREGTISDVSGMITNPITDP